MIRRGSKVKKSFIRERIREVKRLKRGTKMKTESKVRMIIAIEVPFR